MSLATKQYAPTRVATWTNESNSRRTGQPTFKVCDAGNNAITRALTDVISNAAVLVVDDGSHDEDTLFTRGVGAADSSSNLEGDSL